MPICHDPLEAIWQSLFSHKTIGSAQSGTDGQIHVDTQQPPLHGSAYAKHVVGAHPGGKQFFLGLCIGKKFDIIDTNHQDPPVILVGLNILELKRITNKFLADLPHFLWAKKFGGNHTENLGTP